MKATDAKKISMITSAINEKVPNLDIRLNETDADIILTVKLPKVGTIGRPRKVDPLQTELAADRIVEAQINRQEVEKAGGKDDIP